MKISKSITKLKNAAALAAATVVRKEIELRIAKDARDKVQRELDVAIGQAAAISQADDSIRSLFLVTPGNNKIGVIKAIREITSLGLKEAKDLVDESVNKEKFVAESKASEISRLVSVLHAVGATTRVA